MHQLLPDSGHTARCGSSQRFSARGCDRRLLAASAQRHVQIVAPCIAQAQALPRATSAPEQEPDGFATLGEPIPDLNQGFSEEKPSFLQAVVDRSMQQQQASSQRPRRRMPQPAAGQPHPSSPHWRVSGRRHLVISTETPAGKMAGALAGMLRTHSCADITFFSIMSIFKCLKVLALTNIFLDQHESNCSFVFSEVSEAEHQQRIHSLMQHHNQHLGQSQQPQQRQQRLLGQVPLSRPGAPRPPPGMRLQQQELRQQQLRQQQQQSGHQWAQPPSHNGPSFAAQDQQQPQQQQQQVYMPGAGPEPVPGLPMSAFNLHAWMAPKTAPAPSTRGSAAMAAAAGVQRLDFSLDLRQQWNRIAYLSFDTAMSIADSLFAQLMAQLHSPQPRMAQAQPMQPVTGPVHRRMHEKQVAVGPQSGVVPTILCDTDLNQAMLIFASLCFVQQRLTNDKVDQKLVVSVIRHAHNSPRLDGRNGFLLQLQLMPSHVVESHLSKQRVYRKSKRRPVDGATAGNGQRGARQGKAGRRRWYSGRAEEEGAQDEMPGQSIQQATHAAAPAATM